MFIFGCVLLILAVVAGVSARRLKAEAKDITTIDAGHRSGYVGADGQIHIGSAVQSKSLGFISMVLGGVGFALVVGACFTSVSSGQVGVPVVYGSVQQYFIPEGLHPVNPFATVKEMSVRSQT